jgi:alkylation response protein AidB-like acyl-CoA dehydrogenase
LPVKLTLSSDQEFFHETTARFLDESVPPGTLRELRTDPTGFDRGYWKQGAELGWTSLLVDEAHGGGTISGAGLVDLGLVAYEFGRHAAPGPLVSSNVVVAALSRHGDNGIAADHLPALLSGDSVASWCAPHIDGVHDGWWTGVRIELDGDELVVEGEARPVESASDADVVLVTGQGDGGTTQALVPASAVGFTVGRLGSVDLTRRYGTIRFDAVRVPAAAAVGRPGKADADVEHQLLVAAALVCAESVGAMQAAFDMTVEWAFDRYSFGRPLASYQALKHRFADMFVWLQASHAVSDAALAAVDSGAPGAAELVSAAKAYVGEYGAELIQECVQLHGGMGMTFEHDVHLYLRRLTVDRALYGTPADHVRSVGVRAAVEQELA